MENISGKTFRVHSHQHAGVRSDVSQDERDVLVLIDVVAVAHDTPGPAFRRKASFGDAVHEPLRLKAMRHELGNGDECKTVLLRKAFELGPPGARAILAENLANHSSRYEAGKASEINSRLGVSDALKHPSLARTKRRYVAGTTEISGNGLGIDGDADGFGAVLGTYSRGNAKAFVRIDADGESSAVLVGVDLALLSELELVSTLPGEG